MQKKLKPGLVASYYLRPGNGMGLFWKKQIGKWGSKQVKKKVSGKKQVRKKIK